MELFAAAHLLGRLLRLTPRRRLLKKGLWLLALFCCFLALARPQYGFTWVEVKRKGIDILIALDTSKSMLTEDIRPNRLERSKLAIIDFVNQLEGDRVGLLPFAGSAFILCPLTVDYSAFATALTAIDTAIIPRGGTDLAQAITQAESSLLNNANHKILILLTDGENLEGDALAATTKAARNGMTIFTVGVGTIEGELIPLADQGPGNFIKDEAGKFITSRLDEKALTAIAEAAGGIYVPLGNNGEGLARIYQQKLSLIPKKELAEKRHQIAVERFSWPLGLAILLLAFEFMISGRKAEGSFTLPLITSAGRRIRRLINRRTVSLILLMTMGGIDQARASKGEQAFAAGDFLAAAEFYNQALQKQPDDPRVHYNLGTAAYKNNLFEEAGSSFREALKKSEDPGLQEQIYYNLGNALFKQGEEMLQQDPQQTTKLWQQSVAAFAGSSQLNPQARDAQENKELVQKKIDELRQLQEQQDKQDKQDKQNNDQQEEHNKEQQQEQSKDQQQEQQQSNDQQDQEDNGDQSDQQDEKGSEGNASDNAGPDSAPAAKEAADHKSEETEPDKQADNNGQAGPADGSGEQEQDEQLPQAGPGEAPPVPNDGRLTAGMTGDEARQLIDRLKNEEGVLNFGPRDEEGEDRLRGQEGSWKDW